MADAKISALPASTTPLAGTEIVPIVQGGTTKKVTVSDLTAGRSMSVGAVTQPGVTFANLPAATSVAAGTKQFVSDVGGSGTWWTSTGKIWVPAASQVYLKSAIPFIVAPSGTITATTGVLTLGTTIGVTYVFGGLTSCYMYFPAGAFTGSQAGWYYVLMTNGTDGVVYSDRYTTGIPSIPATPTLVTTGTGAYTGVTGAILGPNVVLPGNVFINSQCYFDFRANGSNNNSAGVKSMQIYLDSASTNIFSNTTGVTGGKSLLVTNAVTGTVAIWSIPALGYEGLGGINFTTSKTIGYIFNKAAATDYVGSGIFEISIK